MKYNLHAALRICTAADIGLGPGMLSSVRDAPVIGRSLALGNCSQLDLSMMPIGIEGAIALAHALSAGAANTALTHVNLTWSGIGRGCTMLLKALGELPELRSLDLSGNWLGDEFAPRVGRMMRKALQLRVLRLRWNSFSDSSGRLIAQSLPFCPHLEELDLGGNWIRTAGATTLARRLQRHPGLQRVRLDHNGIDSNGFRVIAQSLAGNNSVLQSLDVGGNEIDDAGAQELARVLTAPSALLRVSLRLNERVTDAGAATLAAAIGSGAKLTQLDLGGNRVGSAGAAALAWAASANRGIRELYLDDNSPERRLGRAYTRLDEGVLRSLGSILTARAVAQSETRVMTPSNGSGAGWWTRFDSAVRRVVTTSSPQGRVIPERSISEVQDYWRLVYPLAAAQTLKALSVGDMSATNILVYKTAPPSLLGRSCDQQPWRVCRLDAYFKHGQTPPQIPRGAIFAPFRMPPGTCMRSLFGWQDGVSRAQWEGKYPYAAGAPDNSWLEVAHTRDQSGGAWMYRARGSGIFWNCGSSLRARNKVAAALRLAEQFASQLPAAKAKGRPVDILARAIENNDEIACDDDHCTVFMQMLRSNRTDRNDNCFGEVRATHATLPDTLSDPTYDTVCLVRWCTCTVLARDGTTRYLARARGRGR